MNVVPQKDHLKRVRAGLDEVTDEVRDLVEPLSPEQRVWRPEARVWGVADCFAHLVETDRLYRPGIIQAIERAEAAGSEPGPDWSPTWTGRMMGYFAGRTVRIRVPAPPAFRPPAEPDPGAPEQLLAEQDRLRELIDRAAALDIARVKVASPVSSLLRFNLGEMLYMAVEHHRRHLEQAHRVTLRPDFPSS